MAKTVGSEVHLKGNTQRMAIEDIRGDVAICTYLHDGKKVRAEFVLDVLVECAQPEGPTLLSQNKYDWVRPK